VLDGRANGGWRVRSLADFPDRYLGTSTKNSGDAAGETSQRRGKSAIFSIRLSRPPPPALARWLAGTSTRRKVVTGGAATTLRRGLRDAMAGSTSDRVRRVFPLAFPLFSWARPKSHGS
jgi:hypothetical protein